MSYQYKAKVIRWVDGDTVWLEVDLGFRMKAVTDFRLYGVDTPERGQEGFDEATALVNRLAPSGSVVLIDTYKDPDKYGRWLADVTPDGDYLTVNQRLLREGLAEYYVGGKR